MGVAMESDRQTVLVFLQLVEASIALAMEPARSKEHLYLHETLGVCSECVHTKHGWISA